ncbi:MAG: amino acid transporter, partial [Alphaproteobacteria bacterium]|nr:amino acid transporter [Alphaproteobacteria bacterium]
MITLRHLRTLIVGKAKDALAPEARTHMALAAFLAWIGLGADGLSSANYGPEEAFLALGEHTHLALYIAGATALTVLLISLAYNQVIALFPSGGGGYKVATVLISPHAGLIGGAALIVDYVLTIAISIASGVDALFSLLPIEWQPYKLGAEVAISVLLLVLNLRGVQEP